MFAIYDRNHRRMADAEDLSEASEFVKHLGVGSTIWCLSPPGDWIVWVEGAQYPDDEDYRHHLFTLQVKRARRASNMTMTLVWVKFDRVGFHHFPAAKTDPKLEDVCYLGHVHRHKFFFNVKIEVFHDDREIEFHQLLNRLTGYMDDIPNNYDHKSCEMLAHQVVGLLNQWYPGRHVIVEVSEDNECGATVIKRGPPQLVYKEIAANDEQNSKSQTAG